MMLRRRGSLSNGEGATVKDPEAPPALADVEAAAARLWADMKPLPAVVTVRYGDIEVRLEAAQAIEGLIPPAVMPAAAGNGAASVAVANDHHVRAPLVGTFYRAPAPGEPPFVEIGDVVRTGQQVGIIEAMKMMVPVESDVAGRVTGILVGNGEQVEFGSSLVVVAGG
jgi:acetyl-CoA carboxylase biotin carboxyl carrier protein